MTPVVQDENMRLDSLQEEAALWRFLHDLFRSPSPKQWNWLHDRRTQEAWMLLGREMGVTVPEPLPFPSSLLEYEQEYIAFFEVGIPEPPCPLLESHWNKRDPLTKILHENMLFYKQFGLQLRSSAYETADHLRHQLEFMRYLCVMEIKHVPLAEQIALAREEYRIRHLLSWIPRAAFHLESVAPDSWAAHWMSLLSACCGRVCPLPEIQKELNNDIGL